MTSTPSVYGSISPLYPAPADMPVGRPRAGRRNWRVTIAARRAACSDVMGSVLRASEDIHSVEHIEPACDSLVDFFTADPDLLIVHDEILQHPAESHVQRILQQGPGVRLLVFGTNMSDDVLSRLAGAGIHGYFNGRPDADEIRLALQSLMAGHTWIEHRIVASCPPNPSSADGLLTERLCHNIERMCAELTRREQEILCQVIRGYAIKQIAAEVHLSHQGVKMHLARLFRKFSASNRNQLILAVLDRISPVEDLSLSLCRELHRILLETRE